ncbi:MAG: hypothetical protein BWX79_02515 [Alphaproteobacteria bacterium ADurb.Bin100]|nr:MAG: hypothetical protein BWX79_02515 [Alphaproteobacteria bacterium ADurb.Bin100]
MSPVSDFAVRKMIGMSRHCAEALIRVQVSKPSISGIMTSSRIRSGRTAASTSSACRPLVAMLIA